MVDPGPHPRFPVPPPPSTLSRLHDAMKSFIWFTTILLLCVELAHAAHITPVHVQRHTPQKSSSRSFRRRGTRTCNPPTTNTTNNDTNDPSSQLDTTGNGGFPSLGFSMPSSVPSSLDGWWSDYTSEIGFLGFSYAVDNCMSLCNFPRPLS